MTIWKMYFSDVAKEKEKAAETPLEKERPKEEDRTQWVETAK